MLFCEQEGAGEEWSEKVGMNRKTVRTQDLLVQGIPNNLDLLECKEQGEELRLERWARLSTVDIL